MRYTRAQECNSVEGAKATQVQIFEVGHLCPVIDFLTFPWRLLKWFLSPRLPSTDAERRWQRMTWVKYWSSESDILIDPSGARCQSSRANVSGNVNVFLLLRCRRELAELNFHPRCACIFWWNFEKLNFTAMKECQGGRKWWLSSFDDLSFRKKQEVPQIPVSSISRHAREWMPLVLLRNASSAADFFPLFSPTLMAQVSIGLLPIYLFFPDKLGARKPRLKRER